MSDMELVHEPKPRNPRLAAAFKRVRLVEQTDLGANRILHAEKTQLNTREITKTHIVCLMCVL